MKRNWFFTGIFLIFSSIFLCLPAQASADQKIDMGSAVQLSYFMEANGVPVISEKKKEEMRLVIGRGAYPQAFEKQLIGLAKGEAKNIQLVPDQAYGPHKAELVKRVPKEQFPSAMLLKEGALIGSKSGRHPMRIAKVLEDSVILDENHPLAGKTLTYHVQVTNVQ